MKCSSEIMRDHRPEERVLNADYVYRAVWYGFVGRDSAVDMATCCVLDGPWIESIPVAERSKGKSAADRLLGLRVRIPPGSWMFVLCMLYSKGQKAKPGHSVKRSTDKVKKKVPV